MRRTKAALVGGVTGAVFMLGLIAVLPSPPVAPAVAVDDDDASAPPDPDPCFPPDTPPPDSPALTAISNLVLKGEAGEWRWGSETFSLAVVNDTCELTIGESTYTVTGFWSASPASLGVSGGGHSLDVSGTLNNWKVGYDETVEKWQATIRIDDVGHTYDGSETE